MTMTGTLPLVAQQRMPTELLMASRYNEGNWRWLRREDVNQVIILGRIMHMESAYSNVPYSVEACKKLTMSFLDHPTSRFAMTYWYKDRVIGMFGGVLVPYFFSNQQMAQDVLLFIHPMYRARGGVATRGFIRKFRQWAKELGANEVSLGVSAGIDNDAVGALYEKLGLQKVGAVYKENL